MDKYQKLILQHAYYSDLIRSLKDQGRNEASKCLGVDVKRGALGDKPFMPTIDSLLDLRAKDLEGRHRVNCIENAYTQMRDADQSFYEDSATFEEIYADLDAEGLVCPHCHNVRQLKKERMKAIRGLGAVRAAMTKAGRQLANEVEA